MAGEVQSSHRKARAEPPPAARALAPSGAGQGLMQLCAALNGAEAARGLRSTAHLLNGRGVVQRDILGGGASPTPFSRATNMYGQIIRPAFIGHWANNGPGNRGLQHGQSRNHVISHHHISEALTNTMNAIFGERLANRMATPPALTDLWNITNSLFPDTNVPGYPLMEVSRARLVLATYDAVRDVATLGPVSLAGHAQTLGDRATDLESHLTSAHHNVRGGNAVMNVRIGNNIDADYAGVATLTVYPAPMALPGGLPVPAAWDANGGAQWGYTNRP